MSFQGYLDTIQAKTGRSPGDFRDYAAAKGWTDAAGLRAGLKAGTIVDDLKTQFGLGHGHAMAIVALLKGTKREGDA